MRIIMPKLKLFCNHTLYYYINGILINIELKINIMSRCPSTCHVLIFPDINSDSLIYNNTHCCTFLLFIIQLLFILH